MVLLESQIKLKKGDIAPDFELLGIDDKKHTLKDYEDYKGILVIFKCNHCPYVKAKVDWESRDILNVGLVSVYSWENTWEIGNKNKIKMIPKIDFCIKLSKNKPLILFSIWLSEQKR